MSVNFVEEEKIQDYFENLAKVHKEIAHTDEMKSFFVVTDKYDLDEIDKAVRSYAKFPAVLLESIEGDLDDNGSANYTDAVNVTFSILLKGRGRQEIRNARNNAKRIGMEFLTRMRMDKNNGVLFGKPTADMQIKASYQPIGKIDPDLYGFIFSVKIICPFSFSSNSATWSDL